MDHIIQIIDQNGHTYVTNEYDEAGRLIAQYYLDGTKSIENTMGHKVLYGYM